MSAQGIYKVTEDLEFEIAKYTNAPYCVAVDNCSNAIFLALKYSGVEGKEVGLPKHTYPSVACEIIHAGGTVKFWDNTPVLNGNVLTGSYRLDPTEVWDSALGFTANMYMADSFMCLSFTGPHKHFKLSKGGAILTDNEDAYKWFKKARFSGRSECSYHEDNFDENPVIGWNMYMPVQTAILGLQLIPGLYNQDGTKKHFEDVSLPYPDLSKFKLWQQ